MSVFRKGWLLLKNAAIQFDGDDAIKLSASLSYYTIFSLGPMLVVIISFAGIFFGQEAVQGKLYGEMRGLIGNEAALQIQDIIANIQTSQHSVAGAIIGMIMLLIGATGVFSEIQGSINYIWSIKAKPKKGWKKWLLDRLLSFSLVISCGFILLVSLAVNTIMEVLNDRLRRHFEHVTIVAFYIFNLVFIFLIITLLFAVIFKVLPDATIRWKDALVGAAFTALLFMLGKFLIGLYLGNSAIGLTYGTAASIIIVLVWVYYSSIILYFGAEFTKVYAINNGAGIAPRKTAVFIVKSEAKEVERSKLW
jgi:membrane protein